MTDRDFTNSGALFKNKYKTKETQPSHKGDLVAICPHCMGRIEYWMSGWAKAPVGQINDRWMSVAIDPKEKDKYKGKFGNDDAELEDLPPSFTGDEEPF